LAKKLTAKTIENLRPGPRRREISDGASGLFLVMQPSGAKSWAVRYRYDGRPTKLTLGPWPTLTLAAARKGAADALHELAEGRNPAAAREAAKIKAAAAQADTLASVCENYLKREGGKLRTVDQRVSILRRLIYPTLSDRPIGSIKRSEIVHLLDRIEDHNGPRAADVALAVLRRIFHWHEKRSDEFRSPIIRGMGARQNVVEHRRTRILNDHEIHAMWTATGDRTPFSALVRLALLTSARRSEIAGLCWSEIDANGLWTLPASRSKTKTEVVRPLSKAAMAILSAQPRIYGCDYVLTSNGVRPIASFGERKRRLDVASGVTGWRLHDLRRTARSLLSRAGINSDVAEKCLGHLPRNVIIQTYDRHSYADEMAHAFEALAALIERIANPPDAAVLPFRR
jgi:integrase